MLIEISQVSPRSVRSIMQQVQLQTTQHTHNISVFNILKVNLYIIYPYNTVEIQFKYTIYIVHASVDRIPAFFLIVGVMQLYELCEHVKHNIKVYNGTRVKQSVANFDGSL